MLPVLKGRMFAVYHEYPFSRKQRLQQRRKGKRVHRVRTKRSMWELCTGGSGSHKPDFFQMIE
jgi:hypothetical protein